MSTLLDYSHDQDEIIFADDSDDEVMKEIAKPWKVILVDDEPAIHDVTKMALGNFVFAERGLEFISAYSGAEAKQAILDHPDTAVMLLDVVMETDYAGLDVACFVREEAQNKSVRIVLRTGQPGQAPEKHVITEYDINDYKEKTELTSSKLFTLMYSSLRSYRDIIALEANKRGLEQVIEASSSIFEVQSMQQFTQGVLEQITSLLHMDQNAAYFKADGLAAAPEGDAFRLIAGIGAFEKTVAHDSKRVLPLEIENDLHATMLNKRNQYFHDRFTGFFRSALGTQNLVHMSGLGKLSELDRSLLEIFTKNVGVAFENIELHQDLEEAHREIVYLLGEAVETRSKETGNHVKRVAEVSKILALGCGLDTEEAETIRLAAPIHDIGKIGIPDAILNKPGRHTAEEFEVMKSHAVIGYEMLKNSKRRILKAGAVIARDHHEKWDGSGYPHGRSGKDIHLYGRIVAVADVFDALGAERCYKSAWPLEKIAELFKEQRGKHFDPVVIDGLFRNLDQILAIYKTYAD